MQEKGPQVLMLWRNRKIRCEEPLLPKHGLILCLVTPFLCPLSIYNSFGQDAHDKEKVVSNGQLYMNVPLPLGLNLQCFRLLFCFLPLHPVTLWPLLNPVGTNHEGHYPLLLATLLPAAVTVMR